MIKNIGSVDASSSDSAKNKANKKYGKKYVIDSVLLFYESERQKTSRMRTYQVFGHKRMK